MRTIPIHYFDYCASSLGLWSRSWHPTKTSAEAGRREWRRLIDGEYVEADDMCGEYGQIGPIFTAYVTPTPEGVIEFLGRYGDAND